MVCGGHAAVDRLLQKNFLDVIRRKATLGEGGANMQAEFVPLTERDEGADDKHAARTLVEMRSGPDLAPGIARDQVLEFDVERISVGDRFVDPGVAENAAAPRHAAVVALLIVHSSFLPSSRGVSVASRSRPPPR